MLQHQLQFLKPVSRKWNRLCSTGRAFTYFDNFEIKNNVGIIRINGPNKMNTISKGMQTEVLYSNIIHKVI
jgi:hypothetical protein